MKIKSWTARRLRFSLTWRFAIAALLITLAIGFSLDRALSGAFVGNALADARSQASDLAQRRIIGRLSPSDLNAPFTGERYDTFNSFVQSSIISQRNARVKIWDPNGRVIYSDDRSEVGKVIPIDGSLAAALSGQTASNLSSGTRAENSGAAAFGRLLEVYAPILFPGSATPAGAVEMDQAYDPVARDTAAVERDLALGLGAGLAVLYLALLGIVRGGARTISRQNRDLERVSDEQQRAEEARAQLAAIIDATPDYVSITGGDGRIRYLNRAGRRLLGHGAGDDLSSTEALDHFSPWARALLSGEGIPAAERTGVWSGETALRARDGHEIPVSQVILAHPAPSGQVDFFSSVARDISERKHFESQLLHLVGHDPLTNLFNRRRFQEELERELNQAQRSGTHGALLFLDLDGFKGINDSFGHRVGDELLISLADKLRSEASANAITARLGGDEFAVLLPQADPAAARLAAERLLDTIRGHTLLIDGESVEVTASLGIARFPEHGEVVEELLVHADFAMYQAKERRDAYAVYTPERNARAAFTSFLTWEHRLRDALDHDRFVLHAQPIRDLRSGRMQYELLLRLMGEDGAIVLPDAFMGVAERSGLIRAIDRWVVREAIRLIAAHRRGGHHLNLEVNLSGKAFADTELLPLIEQELTATQIDPAQLVLEITETAAIADINEARRFIGTLKRLGCRFALDDFGVGFSSFYYLKHLPVDYLKIDGSFIRDLPHDPVDQHLVKAIVEVARGLKKQTIAEFVSDEETVRLLRQFGVDFAQGYHIGRPQPLEELLTQAPRPSRAAAPTATPATRQ